MNIERDEASFNIVSWRITSSRPKINADLANIRW